MYIWNINKLVTALKERTVNDKQRKSYSITFWAIVALTVLSLPVVYNPSSMNRYDVIDLFLFIIINVIAIYLLISIYKKRSRKDLDFFLPFFSLMIPLFLRNILWTILLTIIGFIYIGFFAPYHSMDETNLIDVIIAAIVEIVMNIMFVHYFKKIYN
ncbi:hypothetical protein [Peribacillus butanolivorans]|uniref:hypothetical protein n=1 Tax=Peribacillus butanolivorans TaxID=421767 RepID=UPI0006A72876|nr:hypothetical protein [Peribacillus butanolivorans]KON68604.1 hypothetical protein AKG34_07090 [Peribacillus butanolivorans]QNU05438.1 hypothetical protein GM240_17020 [Peribacillus butanolivorans]